VKRRWLIILISALLVLAAISPVYAGWSKLQDQMHSIAQTAREAGLSEDSPIITEASRIWWEENVRMTREAEERAEAEAELQGFLQEHNADAVRMAKAMYCEARGISSKRELSMICWAILNRVDSPLFPNTISGVITPGQIAYRSGAPTVNDHGIDLVALAQDVLTRYWKEKHGETNVGRTLPPGYVYYAGDGYHNYFREQYRGRGSYNFGLWDPYN
jgi:hypothetical protein